MSKKTQETEAAEQKPLKREIAYRIIHCPLFTHQKHTDACTVLRAKGVCRMQCHDYFEFARANEDAVKKVIEKYAPAIMDHRRRFNLTPEVDLVEYVMPVGEHLCSYCGKAFVQPGRLEKHVETKHGRLIYEEKKQEQAKQERANFRKSSVESEVAVPSKVAKGRGKASGKTKGSTPSSGRRGSGKGVPRVAVSKRGGR